MTSALEHRAAALDSLRATLTAGGYTADAVHEATSATESVGSPALQPAIAYLQTESDDDPLALLARLFWIGATERVGKVARVLPELDVDALADAGVLTLDGDRVSTVVRIDDVFGLLVASDIDHARDDWVVAVSPSTRLAATHTPRVPARSALDMGCGQGFQALLAARHCDRVVATDFNPRALWMTELNARLNGIGNVETREGSFLEPVAGERFDLAVMNPPYVVSPRSRFLYRDGGIEGDGLSRKLLAEIPGHLEDGGFGVLQGNWIHGADEPWFAPVERALAGSGCDAVLARIGTADPLEYAAGWNEVHYANDAKGFVDEVSGWVAHFREQGIERISGAMVVLRRRDGSRHWRRAVSIARQPARHDGERLAALFDAQDRLASLGDDELLDARLAVPAELRVERYERRSGDGIRVLDLDSAAGVRRPVSPELADLVLRLDGSAPLRQVAGEGVDIAGVRALVKLGFVTFADGS